MNHKVQKRDHEVARQQDAMIIKINPGKLQSISQLLCCLKKQEVECDQWTCWKDLTDNVLEALGLKNAEASQKNNNNKMKTRECEKQQTTQKMKRKKNMKTKTSRGGEATT